MQSVKWGRERGREEMVDVEEEDCLEMCSSLNAPWSARITRLTCKSGRFRDGGVIPRMPIETLLFLASMLVVGYLKFKYIMARKSVKYDMIFFLQEVARESGGAAPSSASIRTGRT